MADEGILEYCQGKYERDPTVFVGINRKDPPKDADCPYIVILPGVKAEGEDVPDFHYGLTVGWVISNEEMENNELTGLGECDDLGQLILEAIKAICPDHPVSTVTYELNPVDHFPKIIGEMQLELSITPYIGAGEINYIGGAEDGSGEGSEGPANNGL